MAINIIGGKVNLVHAKQTIQIASTGITAGNTRIIYHFADLNNEGQSPTLSYKPSRLINGITQFISGKSYYLDAIVDMDLSQYLGPPFPTSGTGNAILLEDGSGPVIPEV